jgi:hypothetical protein
MKTQSTNTLAEKQQKEITALNTKIELQNLFFALTGSEASIISPERNPFAVFYPKTKDEYLTILTTLQPTGENAQITFASGNPINTESYYVITYGGKHDSPNYMDAEVKFKHSICPIWVKIPDELRKEMFSVATLKGEHIAFGRYETKYTLHANEKTTIQTYYGENKTMYAKDEAEAIKLKNIIFRTL